MRVAKMIWTLGPSYGKKPTVISIIFGTKIILQVQWDLVPFLSLSFSLYLPLSFSLSTALTLSLLSIIFGTKIILQVIFSLFLVSHTHSHFSYSLIPSFSTYLSIFLRHLFSLSLSLSIYLSLSLLYDLSNLWNQNNSSGVSVCLSVSLSLTSLSPFPLL